MIGGVAYSDIIMGVVFVLIGTLALFRPERKNKAGDDTNQ